MTHQHQHHERLFCVENAASLDEPSRLDRQPPRAIVEALALFGGCRVIDFGAGTGYYAIPIAERLAQLGPGGKVIAVDSQPPILDLLAAKLPSLESAPILLLPGSTDALQALDEASADRALMANVVHEVPDRRALFEATFRALSPQGMLLVLDWHPEGSLDHGPPSNHRVAPDEICRDLVEAGFLQVEALPCYPDHFALRTIRS